MTTSIHATRDIGHAIRSTRKQLGVTQRDLALAAGTGLRFIIELEQGKSTCQIGKILDIMHVLNIQCTLSSSEDKPLDA
ncbi:MAG: helix-turn-helix transcriptional regulator [Legionellaceae bacterium]|jgi:y4mF family transcriptional regulator|nr:helix-turn-helix transcriptional regulator [Legionellaceae bacterium]